MFNFDDLIDILDGEEFEERPVDLRTFVTSPQYLGLPPLSDYQYKDGEKAEWGASDTSELCVGIDNTRGAYVRPVAVQAESGGTFSVLPDGQFDMYGSRVQKVGFYGFLEEGRVCLDARSTVGIIINAPKP